MLNVTRMGRTDGVRHCNMNCYKVLLMILEVSALDSGEGSASDPF